MFNNHVILPVLIILSFSALEAMDAKTKPEEFIIKGADSSEGQRIEYAREDVNEFPFYKAESHEFTLITDSGVEFPVLHIDRGSDVVIVLGQGMSDPKEKMLPIAALFETQDVILFDYRWYDSFNSRQTKALFTGSFITSMFHDEAEEVRTVLAHVKGKRFKKVIGMGLCYSAVLFAKVQAECTENEGFSHLVLDSCMTTLKSIGECMATDPYLMAPAHEGGAPTWLKAITGSRIMKGLIAGAFCCARDINVAKDLKSCTCPILFIHGQKDYMVPEDEFEKLWKAAPADKRIAVLTPFYHAHNSRNRRFYRDVISAFIKESSLESVLSQKK